MRVAAIGDNCIDVYEKLGRAYPTGNAVDFAVNMRKLGIPTSMIGVTGNDEYGRWLIETLAADGLDTSHLRAGDGPTAIAHLDMDGNECIHVRYEEGVLATVTYTPDQIDYAASHDLVHSTPWGHVDPHLEQLRSRGALVSFDYSVHLDHPGLEPSLPFVDYAFFSVRHRDATVESFLRDIVSKGPRVAVATLGPLGSLAWDGISFHTFGIFPATVVNTVGGGDSYIAAFMHSILGGRSVEESMEAGARLAAQVVGVFGPWTNPVPGAVR